MILKILQTFAIVVTFIRFVESKDFCDSFKENDYKISYGFRRVDRRDNDSGLYLFIDHHYWQLNVSEGNLHFLSSDSKESDWFGSHYKLAFELSFSHSSGSPSIGLLNDYMDLIEFRSEIAGHEDLLGFHDIETIELTDDLSLEDFRPTLITQLYKWLQKDGWVALISQNESHIEWKYCYFHRNMTLKSCASEPESSALKELAVLKDMNISQQMIAIFPLRKEDFIVLFKEDTSIQWCAAINTNNSFESKCETSDRLILIECHHSPFYIILIVVIILILIMVIPILCWTLYTKLNVNKLKRIPQESSGTVLTSKAVDSEMNRKNRSNSRTVDSIDSNKPFVEPEKKPVSPKSAPKPVQEMPKSSEALKVKPPAVGPPKNVQNPKSKSKIQKNLLKRKTLESNQTKRS